MPVSHYKKTDPDPEAKPSTAAMVVQALTSVVRPSARWGYAFFLISGLTALIYEQVWLRLFGLVFGNTTHAMSVVLAAYMAGLGLGSLILGRYADRWSNLLRAYGLLELAIGAYAALTFSLYEAIQGAYVSLPHHIYLFRNTLDLARFFLAFAVILIPTLAMGATLPILVRHYVTRRQDAGRQTAWLYGLNTAGAVAGNLLCGFYLLPAFGMRHTLAIAVVLNCGIGLLAWKFSFRMALPPSAPESEEVEQEGKGVRRADWPDHFPRQWIPIGSGIAGAVAMILEVQWTQILTSTVGGTTYSLTVMLATFLLGLALGGAAASRVLRRRTVQPAWWGWLMLLVGVSTLVTLPLLQYFGIVSVRLFALVSGNASWYAASKSLLYGLAMLPAAFGLGALFPVGAALYTPRIRTSGHDLGFLYFSNTLGNVLGCLAAGFVLAPAFGIFRSLQTAGLLIGGCGLLVVLADLLLRAPSVSVPEGRTSPAPSRWPVPIAAALLAGAFWVDHYGWDPRLVNGGIHLSARRSQGKTTVDILSTACNREVLSHREGMNCQVTVMQAGANRFLVTNGVADASTRRTAMRSQLLLGHLPHLLHPAPSRSLVIGFGSGTTLAACLAHPVTRVDCAEIEPAVLDAAPLFDAINRKSYQNPRARIVLNDGRNHLLVEQQLYDVIISQPSNPWKTGVSTLFTTEFYELARKRLAPGGLFCQWFHKFAVAPDDFRMVLASVARAFPHVTLWEHHRSDVLILAGMQPFSYDLQAIQARLDASPEVQSDLLSRFDIRSAAGLFAFLLLDESDFRDYVDGATLNTDDLLPLEFNAGRALHRIDASNIISAGLARYRNASLPQHILETLPPEKRPAALADAGIAYLGRNNAQYLGIAAKFFEQALELQPGHPLAQVGLARCFLVQAKVGPALSLLSQAAQTGGPNAAEAYAYVGWAGLKGGYVEGAKDALLQAVRLQPDQWQYHFWTGQASEQLKLWKEARESYECARTLAPDQVILHLAFARATRLCGDAQAALKLLEDLVVLYKTYFPFYLELAETCKAMQNLDPAIQAFEKLVRLNPYSTHYWYHLAKLYELNRDHERLEWATRHGSKSHRYFKDLLALDKPDPAGTPKPDEEENEDDNDGMEMNGEQ
ncbi:MAG: fused MFS/spermidine synthase [Planctomycetes bacterium]|nr:fused MFS/spermidine synthase [Planctomycetota bacterium]